MVKISIITVCYNAISCLEATIASVINQSYDKIEYIVIDGASRDGSTDIINKYSDRISYWVSEPDKGIYDAMNKGIMASNGDYLLFMNAGDTFYDKDTVKRCVSMFEEDSDIIVYYGNTLCKYPKFFAEVKPLPLDTITQMLPFCHQSCFIKSSYHISHLYNLEYKIFADQVFFLELYKNQGRFREIDILISIYDAEYGISSTVSKKKVAEYLKVKGVLSKRNYYKELFFAYWQIIKVKLKKLLTPTSLYWGSIMLNTLSRPNVYSIKKRKIDDNPL